VFEQTLLLLLLLLFLFLLNSAARGLRAAAAVVVRAKLAIARKLKRLEDSISKDELLYSSRGAFFSRLVSCRPWCSFS